MGNHERPRLSVWAGLLFMASMAQALTLSNFQLITAGAPIPCILGYNSNIPDCSTTDFTQGNTCSAACLSGLAKVQKALLQICDQATAPDSSVLGQVLKGNLVNLLCPAAGTTIPTSSKKTKTASTATASSTVSTALSKSTLTPVVSSTATPSRTETLANDIPTLSPPPGPSSGPPSAPPPRPVPTQATGAQQSIKPAEPTSERPLGGGSPFDPVVSTGGSTQLANNLLSACCVGLILSFLLAR